MSTIAQIVETLKPAAAARIDLLTDVAKDLHAHPEIRFEERHAAARLTTELEQAGFAVERNYADLETAFVARWSTPDATDDSPTVAVFCEYDALEEIGHACGHNVIAASGLGGALLVKEQLEAQPAPAHLVVAGSPGEEGGGGKVLMIDAGVLEGVDIAMMVHPYTQYIVGGSSMSRVALDVTFHGKAAHAAAAPSVGRNALDAATLSLTAIGLLRQQLTDDVRVHAIITNGGEAPNIIPETAALRIFVRTAEREHLLNDVEPRVRACFEGAALATGCTVDIEENTPPYYSLKPNGPLDDLAAAAFEALGEQPDRTPSITGSTDMGNVSQVVPSIHPMVKIDDTAPPHTRDFAAAANGPYLQTAVHNGAVMLAATALSAIVDPEVIVNAKRAFAEN